MRELTVGKRAHRHCGMRAKAHRVLLLAAQLFIAAMCLAAVPASSNDPYVPVKWTRFVKVDGQPEPIPEQWLDTDEARVAHSLELPDSVPKPVPFDFGKAWWSSWLPGTPQVAVQYFNHLCRTEAGERIFRKVQNVDGLYFARPQGPPTTDTLTDPYGPEMPWIQRVFLLTGESLKWQGTWFIQPPIYNYRFVEHPRRDVKWQTGINEPYVRLFGYTREPALDQDGKVTDIWKDRTPMQVVGIPKLSARYGYTWRGLKRERDREFGVAGGDVLIYDMKTKEVLAVRRQFLIAFKNPRGAGKAMWEVAASCSMTGANSVGLEFKQFAFDVLQTIDPSTTRK